MASAEPGTPRDMKCLRASKALNGSACLFAAVTPDHRPTVIGESHYIASIKYVVAADALYIIVIK